MIREKSIEKREGKNKLIFDVSSYDSFMRRELIIIDGFNLIFRVFYAVPSMHTKDGKPANALF